MRSTTPSIPVLPPGLPASLPEAALAYAAAGVPVFPCVPGEKRPLTKSGYLEASADPARVASWWRWQPEANIGIPTGHRVDVLDIDVHAGGTGFTVLRTLQQERLIAGWAQAVRSPSGGLHLYYPTAPDSRARSWSRGTSHVDFRGVGGYIIAPPSRITTPAGERQYQVIAIGRDPAPVDANRIRDLLTPAPVPASPRDPNAPVEARVAGLTQWVSGLPEGNRNAGLFWAACRMVEQGLPITETAALLESAAESAGLPLREVQSTIQSAYRTAHLTPAPDVGGIAGFVREAPVRS